MTAEALFREHHDTLTGVLARRFPGVCRSVLDDAISQTWLIALRKADSIDEATALSYLVTVARHEVYAILTRPTVAPLEHDVIDVGPDLVDVIDAGVRWARIVRELPRMNRNQRTALTGRALGLSYGQLAAATGHTPTWANRHISEGRRALRTTLAAA